MNQTVKARHTRKGVQGTGFIVVLLFSSLFLITQPGHILPNYNEKLVNTKVHTEPPLADSEYYYSGLDTSENMGFQDHDQNPIEERFRGEGEVQMWNSSKGNLDWIRNRTKLKYSVPSNPGTPHGVIVINNDSDFVDQGWPGTGIQSDPYRIENLSITAGWGNSCIEVRNTRKHFVINDCRMSVSWSGIELYNVSNAQITDNTFVDIYYVGVGLYNANDSIIISNSFEDFGFGAGVKLKSSHDNDITDNTFYSIGIGIELHQSHLNRLTNNTISDSYLSIYTWNSNQSWVINQTCGSIIIGFSFSNTIKDNHVESGGLELYSTYNNTIVDNRFQGCGIAFDYVFFGVPYQETVSGNTVNSKPLVFWQDQVGGSVPQGAGQVILVACSGVRVSNQTISDCEYGISLYWSNQCFITYNALYASTIFLFFTNATIIDSNECTFSKKGIYLDYRSWNNRVSYNTINYSETGIYVSATSTLISDNFVHSNSYIGIDIWGLNNTIANNICIESGILGINVWGNENSIVNNTCTYHYNGIFVSFSRNVTVSENTCKTNENGIVVKYNMNITVSHNTCSRNSYHGIYVQTSYSRLYNTTVVGNLCNENGMDGIHLSRCRNVVVSENRCIDNFSHGIFANKGRENNTICCNECSGNDYDGIHFMDQGNCSVSYNICTNNGRFGISLYGESGNNTIHWNVFANNWEGNGFDNSSQNIFDYNLWADYQGVDWNFDGFGDTLYFINGSAGNFDPHPLMQWPGAIPASTVILIDIALACLVIGLSACMVVIVLRKRRMS